MQAKSISFEISSTECYTVSYAELADKPPVNSLLRAGWALRHAAVSRAYQGSPQRATSPLDAYSAAS
jgi:hypothetical protein